MKTSLSFNYYEATFTSFISSKYRCEDRFSSICGILNSVAGDPLFSTAEPSDSESFEPGGVPPSSTFPAHSTRPLSKQLDSIPVFSFYLCHFSSPSLVITTAYLAGSIIEVEITREICLTIMSLTARERRNPPTRRKSCAACTKAKRRCDFAMPACLRCSQRQIQCQYPARVVRGQLASQSESPEIISPGLLTTEDSSPQTTESLSSNAPSVEDFNAVISGLDTCSDDLGTLEFPLEDNTLKFIEQPWTLTAPSIKDFAHVPEHILNRLQWTVDEIKRAPEKMVLENQTPWSHPLLYKDGMPRSIRGKKPKLFYHLTSLIPV